MIVRAYHLTSASHAIRNLQKRHLKIATFDDLNDPFELWAVSQPSAALRRGLRGFKKQMARGYGVLCFSKDWQNPVLWSHYADRHRGVALGFDIASELVQEVVYSKVRPPLTALNRRIVQTLLYTKSRDWEYEKEVRVFAALEDRDPETGLYFGDFNEQMVLREIVIGPLCPMGKLDARVAAGDKSITVTKARLAFNSFRVVANQRGLDKDNAKRLA